MKTVPGIFFLLFGMKGIGILGSQSLQPPDRIWPRDAQVFCAEDLDKLSGYTSILGDLNIEKSSLENLRGLERLRSVQGSLRIQDNRTLTTLEGLNGLIEVGRDLIIASNQSLHNLDALSSLKRVDSLEISHNVTLENLNGMKNLQSVYFYLAVQGNYSLTSLDGLESISEIHGGLYIESNMNLISIQGLKGLRTIGGLFIAKNPKLSNLSGLEGLRDVDGNLELKGNDSLFDLNVLNGIKSFSGKIDISDNPKLKRQDVAATKKRLVQLSRVKRKIKLQVPGEQPSPRDTVSQTATLPGYPIEWIEEAKNRYRSHDCQFLVYKKGCSQKRTGSVVLKILLDNSGQVKSIETLINTISRDPRLVDKCLRSLVRPWRFHPPKGVQATFEMAFDLSDMC